uniref:Metastriate one of each protein family n=1 Tax=Rhipicephalus appendiculatus TaxID=34631 RepID=A0A131Z2L9_RHIAP
MALKSVAIWILLAFMFSGVLAAEDECKFHDEHLERAINSFIEKLPAERSETPDKDSETPEEIDIIEFKFLGLNSFRPFGPFLTFCRDGSRFVQFDMVNKRPLILVGTIKGNDSNTNELLTRALLVRFTAQFEVEGSGEDVKIHPTVNMPVSMVGLSMLLKTVDKETKEDIGIILHSPKPHFLRTLWHGMLFSELDKLFGEISPRK